MIFGLLLSLHGFCLDGWQWQDEVRSQSWTKSISVSIIIPHWDPIDRNVRTLYWWVFPKLRDPNLSSDPSNNKISRNYSIYHHSCHQFPVCPNNKTKTLPARRVSHILVSGNLISPGQPGRFFTIKAVVRRALGFSCGAYSGASFNDLWLRV